MDPLKRRLCTSGAFLFCIGMWTGLWSAFVLTGHLQTQFPRLALAAHLNGLVGGLWLIAVGFTLEQLHYGEEGKQRLAKLVQVPAWANWAVTLVASALGVRGLEYTSDATNNVIAGLLQSLVVLPTLIGATAWAWGFRAKQA